MAKRYNSMGDKKKTLQSVMPIAAIGLFFFIVCVGGLDSAKYTTLFAVVSAFAAGIIWLPRLQKRFTLPMIALAAMVLMGGISTFYAIAGKFALNEFLKMFSGFCVTATLLAATPGEGAAPGRRIATILEWCSGLAGLVSIDLISTRLISTPVLGILSLFTDAYLSMPGVEPGVRMLSMFENPNIFGGCAGIGVLLSLGLVLSSENRRERAGHTVCLYLNALSFVLAFSMGATAFIAVAFLAYLIFERKERRGGLFVLMVETLAVTLVGTALTAMTAFDAWDGIQPVPLLCAVFGSAALCLLDQYVGQKVTEKLAGREKVLVAVIGAALCALVGVALLAVNLTGSAALTVGESLRRAAYPAPGEYTVTAETSAPVHVSIETQNKQDTMMHTSTVLYQGDLASASFVVPEDSMVVYFNFYAAEDTVIERVTCNGAEQTAVPLGYKILPGFIANRLQGLWANQNAIQRTVFFEDGMKLFYQSPVFGLGLGSFAGASRSVQTFYYETKYAHNHYIQSLTENGIIGLVLFLAVLGISGAAIFFELRKKENVHPLTPALGAALVFMAGHAAVEVVFSSYPYIPMAYGVIGLIALCCGDAIPCKFFTDEAKKWSVIGCGVLVAVFTFFLVENVSAAKLVEREPTFSNLEIAIQKDKFEWTDYMLSYVVSAPNAPDDMIVQEKAMEYADRLSETTSNSVAIFVAEFYFERGFIRQGFAMVEKHVRYLISDSKVWDDAITLLVRYYEDSDTYREGVESIVQILKDWNDDNMGTIVLNEGNQAFLSYMGLW